MISGGDKTISLWDLQSLTRSFVVGRCLKSVFSVSISKSEKLIASGGADRMIKLWDL